MKASVLEKQKSKSPIKALLKKDTAVGAKEKSLNFSLNLTALIDAFCILVIFLLSNMNGQLKNLDLGKNITLPAAAKTEALHDGLVVRIEKNRFVVNDKTVSKEKIAQALLDAKTKDVSSLVIQADRQSDYENIGMVLRAGGQAGYEKYVFAVLPGI